MVLLLFPLGEIDLEYIGFLTGEDIGAKYVNIEIDPKKRFNLNE
jgi:hypothetical protein